MGYHIKSKKRWYFSCSEHVPCYHTHTPPPFPTDILVPISSFYFFLFIQNLMYNLGHKGTLTDNRLLRKPSWCRIIKTRPIKLKNCSFIMSLYIVIFHNNLFYKSIRENSIGFIQHLIRCDDRFSFNIVHWRRTKDSEVICVWVERDVLMASLDTWPEIDHQQTLVRRT